MGWGGEDGSVVASGSYDATVRLWDCKSQSTKPIQVFEEARDSVSSLHVVGHEIVTGSVDGRMRVYDLRMGMVFVDVIDRMDFQTVMGSLVADGGCLQNPSRLSSKLETDTQFWCQPLTRPLDLWTKAMGSYCSATEDMGTRLIESDLVWESQIQS